MPRDLVAGNGYRVCQHIAIRVGVCGHAARLVWVPGGRCVHGVGLRHIHIVGVTRPQCAATPRHFAHPGDSRAPATARAPHMCREGTALVVVMRVVVYGRIVCGQL